MIKTVEEIIEKITSGTLQEYRSENLELKETWSHDVGKKISAFANSIFEGPIWLCVGIDDGGNICRNDETWAKRTEETISQHLNQYLDPQITCSKITCHSINNQWFVVIPYENPGAVVYWNKKAYKSAGTTILEMTPVDIMQLTVKLPGLADYTAQRRISVVDDSLVNIFAECVSRMNHDVPIVNVKGLSCRDILCRFGIEESVASYILFGPCRYRIVFYDVEGSPTRNEVRTGLFKLLSESFRNEVNGWTEHFKTNETAAFPERALREALANAVAHAAYVENDGEVLVEIFTDKVCISNLCMRESAFFANKWFSRARNTVNRTLMEMLRIAGFVDELGRGKNLIFAESLRNGKRPPEVVIEPAGRYERWRLYLYGGPKNTVQLKLLAQIRQRYPEEQKALIANALVLWRGRAVSDIKQYIDGESSNLFAEVLADTYGPIFYYKKNDEIVPRRWVKVLLGEGKDSKQLSPSEEAALLDFVRKLQADYHGGFITPKELRALGDMGETPSARVACSALLKKWQKQNILINVKKGLYQFKSVTPSENILADLQQFLSNLTSEPLAGYGQTEVVNPVSENGSKPDP
jgi:predicted HTH transcriptional regulator